MTQKDKDLLLKDLCARLPYGVMINIKSKYENKFEIAKLNGYHIFESSYNIEDRGLKPYLRPIDSMTEEEKEYIKNRWCYEDWYDICDFLNHYQIDAGDTYAFIDWLNKKMFDYRGLIDKGLALEAHEGMYNTKTE